MMVLIFFHQTKISIISVYIPPYHSIHYKERDAIFAQLNLWLDKARSNNYHVVILGDFNADETFTFTPSSTSFKNFTITFFSIFYGSSIPYFFISGPSPTFYHQNGSSRLDYIWSSPGFPAPALSLDKLWHALKRSILGGAIDSLPFQHYNTTSRFCQIFAFAKTLVSAYLSTQFHQHRVDSIEYYTALRDEHFSTSRAPLFLQPYQWNIVLSS
ncbi:hypothetical protein RIR_jg38275.t1 [Rhizophagus irregularis DAOM 181602=DAOM 197198]|nr:hypothetical protein RIR_jg38275.t1 [Rhizophagus irregularis DAOM 181602=DAOM 197198]